MALFWIVAPLVLLSVLFGGSDSGRPAQSSSSSQGGDRAPPIPLPLSYAPVRAQDNPQSVLQSFLAPPPMLQNVALEHGRARWLPDIETLWTHAREVQHAIHLAMEPALLARAPRFAYRIEDLHGRALGTFVLTWLPQMRRYGIFQAQGLGDRALDPEALEVVLAFATRLQPTGDLR